jgi:hypothetical protein
VGQTLALNATALLDDGTTLPLNPSLVTWAPVSGSIFTILPSGAVTPQLALANTPATIQGSYLGVSVNFTFTVVSTTEAFSMNIVNVPGDPLQRQIVFGPLQEGYTYTVQTTTSLTGPWTTLNGTVSNSGTERTVTDPNANADPVTFYRVQISTP